MYARTGIEMNVDLDYRSLWLLTYIFQYSLTIYLVPSPYMGRNAVHSVLKLVMGFQFTVLIFDNVYLMNGTMVFFALIYVDSSVVILPSVFLASPSPHVYIFLV